MEFLDLYQDLVSGLLMEGHEVRGLRTRGGITFEAPCVVVTTGTFLR
ncbi:MAG TPA: hypothetical protein DC060_12655, partial [Gemmatimonadetes bacterium]|nr:hypothetical protein [Gemmatimonadota bacterium]